MVTLNACNIKMPCPAAYLEPARQMIQVFCYCFQLLCNLEQRWLTDSADPLNF